MQIYPQVNDEAEVEAGIARRCAARGAVLGPLERRSKHCRQRETLYECPDVRRNVRDPRPKHTGGRPKVRGLRRHRPGPERRARSADGRRSRRAKPCSEVRAGPGPVRSSVRGSYFNNFNKFLPKSTPLVGLAPPTRAKLRGSCLSPPPRTFVTTKLP